MAAPTPTKLDTGMLCHALQPLTKPKINHRQVVHIELAIAVGMNGPNGFLSGSFASILYFHHRFCLPPAFPIFPWWPRALSKYCARRGADLDMPRKSASQTAPFPVQVAAPTAAARSPAIDPASLPRRCLDHFGHNQRSIPGSKNSDSSISQYSEI